MVYFVQGSTTGLIQIGKATDVPRRLRAMQVGSPDRLTVLAVIADKKSDAPLHEKFRDSWDHGTWFRPSRRLLDFIAGLPKSEFTGLKSTQRTYAAVRVARAKTKARAKAESKVRAEARATQTKVRREARRVRLRRQARIAYLMKANPFFAGLVLLQHPGAQACR